jgi:hypothetical protein
MTTMDIFEGDAFSIIELTRALENIPYKPALLSGTGLFSPRGVRSRTVVIESRDGTLSLIPFSERGSAHDQQVPERRDDCRPVVLNFGLRTLDRSLPCCVQVHAECETGSKHADRAHGQPAEARKRAARQKRAHCVAGPDMRAEQCIGTRARLRYR